MRDSLPCSNVLPTDRTSVISDTSTLIGSDSNAFPKQPPNNSHHNSMNSNIYHSPKASSPLVSYKASSPVLLKRATAPVLPSFKPKEQRYGKPQGCSLITAVELGKLAYRHFTAGKCAFTGRETVYWTRQIHHYRLHTCLPTFDASKKKKFYLFQTLGQFDSQWANHVERQTLCRQPPHYHLWQHCKPNRQLRLLTLLWHCFQAGRIRHWS